MAVTGAVKDAHATHANERGVINKVHHSLDGLITAHTSHINIRFKGQFAVVDVIMSLLAYVCSGAYILHFYSLSRLQTVSLYYAGNMPESNRNVIFVD